MDNNQHNQNNGSNKTWLFSILTIIIILAGIMWWMPHVVLGIFYSDLETVDDSELTLDTINVTQENNAYYPLNEIGIQHENIVSEYSGQVSDYTSGESWDQARAQEILDANSAIQEKFAEAATRDVFQIPELRSQSAFEEYQRAQFPQDLDSEGHMSLNAVRHAGRLQDLESRHLLQNDQYEEALDAALVNLQIGEKIFNSQSSPIYNLVGMAIHERGLDAVERIMDQLGDSRPDNLSKVREILKQTSISGLQSVFKIDYQKLSVGLDVMREGGWEAVYGEPLDGEGGALPSDPTQISFYFHVNKTKQMAADYYKSVVGRVESQCWSQSGNKVELEEYNELPEAAWKHKFIPNYAGKVLISVALASPTGFITKICEQQERAQNMAKEITALD